MKSVSGIGTMNLYIFGWIFILCFQAIYGLFVRESTSLMHKIYLDQSKNVFLQWEPSESHIDFQIQAKTLGYVGIGFSHNGGMKGSDILLAWFDRDGIPHLSDRFATGNRMPQEDLSQDYTLLAASKNETHSMFRVRRKYNTCDEKDFNLAKEDTMRIIWALNDNLPTTVDGELIFDYHMSRRGTKSVFLLNKNKVEPPLEPGVKNFDIIARNVTVSRRRHTIYMCHIEELPKLNKKHHIIGFKPVIEERNLKYVHHIVAYECKVDPLIFKQYVTHDTVECYSSNMPPEWFTCAATVFSWALGSEGEMFPKDVGVPLGGEDDANFLLLEIHYDNPEFKRGIVDKSGLRLYYTDKLRTHDAGTLVVGHKFGNWLMVPPNFSNFTLVSHCGSSCLNQGIPENGITVLSAMLHSHQLGKAISVQHFRDGQELPVLIKDDYYDPHYQQSRRIKNTKVYANDHLLTKCVYDSTKRKRVTWGGQSVQEEMCLAIIFYYPKMNVSICTSHPTIGVFENAFKIKARDVATRSSSNDRQSLTSFYIQEPKELENRSVRVYAQKLVKKDPQKFHVLQKNLLSGNFPFVQICHIRNGNSSQVKRTLLQEQLTYMPPEENICKKKSSGIIFINTFRSINQKRGGNLPLQSQKPHYITLS